MISYELAKQLKDAGFPQECSYPSEIYNDRDRGDGTIENGFFIRKPSLSELIEACGKDKVFSLYNGNKRWEASKIGDEKDAVHCYGETPEEAVAHLWLELNKKLSTL